MTDLTASARVARVGTMPKNGNRQYDDGTRTWQSATVLLKNIETDTWNLDEWKSNMLAIGLAGRPDLVLGVQAAAQFDPATGKLTKDAKDALWPLRKQAMDAAKSRAGMNRGNALHTATERLDLGESLESIALPYPFDADLRAYSVLKRAMGLTFRPEHIERTVRVPELDVCGTLDRLGTCALLEQQGILQPGELIDVDVKTEGDPLFNLMHIVPQQAIYTRGDAMWDPRVNGYEPMPAVSRNVALIIHVRDGRATPYLLNLAPGWESAKRAAAQRDSMKASKVKIGEAGCWAMPLDVKLPAGTDLVAQQAAAELAAARERAEAAAAGFASNGCQNCAPLLAGVSATRVDGSEATDWCLVCGAAAPGYKAGDRVTVGGVTFTKHSDPGEVAVRRPDGMVEFQPVPAAPVRSDMEQFAIDAIGQAGDLAALAALFDQVTGAGVAWDGDVKRAGDIRGRIVQCPQRELHTGTGRCACGWREGLLP